MLKAGTMLDCAGILEDCRKKLARDKVPRDACIVDALPHTGSGKIAKRELPCD